jgi:hypothetical protein
MGPWDWKTLVTVVAFVVTQLGIAIVFGARLGTKVDSLKDEFIGFKRDTKNDLDNTRRDLQRIGERIARIEGAAGIKSGGQ